MSVSTRKGTDKREVAQHRFIYKTIYDITNVYLVSMCMYKVLSVSARKDTDICKFVQLG